MIYDNVLDFRNENEYRTLLLKALTYYISYQEEIIAHNKLSFHYIFYKVII